MSAVNVDHLQPLSLVGGASTNCITFCSLSFSWSSFLRKTQSPRYISTIDVPIPRDLWNVFVWVVKGTQGNINFTCVVWDKDMKIQKWHYHAFSKRRLDRIQESRCVSCLLCCQENLVWNVAINLCPDKYGTLWIYLEQTNANLGDMLCLFLHW